MPRERAKPTVALEKERIEYAVGKLRAYMLENFDMEVGNLAARLLIDDVLTYLGVDCYNQGVLDAQRWIGQRVEELYELTK